MDNFKAGDKVVRIEKPWMSVAVGSVYTVKERIGNTREIGSISLEETTGGYMSRYFDLYHPVPEPLIPDTKPLLPHDSQERKNLPVFSVLFGYFPAAMVKLTQHCFVSNEKHNPGEELHWSRGKSDDHKDAAMRHLIEGDHVGLLWRAAALLQLQLEAEGAEKAPLAR